MTKELRAREALLLFSVFVVGVAGLVYELVAGTLSTYLLGSSVTVFSLVIGMFLAAMGLGAFLAKYIDKNLVRAFVWVELVLAVVGGLSALILFAAYSWLGGLYPLALGVVCVSIGALVGVEIPLLLRILEKRLEIRVAISHVLALDYLGALLGSVLFPLLLLPYLGLVRTAALFGLMNWLVAVLARRLFPTELGGRALPAAAALVFLLLGSVFLTAGRTTTWLEDRLYTDPVVLSERTPYQRVVVTRWRDDVRLFLDGNLQVSSVDEYRYHESLVHPAMLAVESPKKVLILGGGDGMAAREVLKHEGVLEVDLVDLDPKVTEIFSNHPMLVTLNDSALTDPRVRVHHQDALRFLEETPNRFDVIVMDLPDPNEEGLSRLYTKGAFTLAGRRLREGGALVTQATSPFFAPDAFWCIHHTLEAALSGGLRERKVLPMHVNVPSFGEWGFVLVAERVPEPDGLAPLDTRYLNAKAMQALFDFPEDLEERAVEVNTLSSAPLARYYRQSWARFRGP